MFFHFTAAASLHGGVTAEPLSRSALGHLFHVSHNPVHLPQWDQPVWDSLWLLPEPCSVGVTGTVAESDRLIGGITVKPRLHPLGWWLPCGDTRALSLLRSAGEGTEGLCLSCQPGSRWDERVP